MNLIWVALITPYVLIEKTLPLPRRWPQISGGLFIFPAKETFSYLIMGTVVAPVLITLVYSWVVWCQEQQDLN